MSLINIIKDIDERLINFCLLNPNYQIYRIGGSLFASEISIHDIDFFIVDESSEINYVPNIINLKNNFSGPGFLNAAVNTYDERLNNELVSIADFLKSNYKKESIHVFGFGPIKMPTDEEILITHLAGPMNVNSSNTFFKEFPLFHFLWAKYNVKLGSKEFNQIIRDPGFSESDIREEFKRIYTRAITIDSLKIKRQCLKRLMLVELAINNHPNPYLESVNLTKDMSAEQVAKTLEKYKSISDEQ